MFDDRLFDTLMEEMMAAFGADVRTDEGSLAFNACAKIAEKLEEVYGDMDEINDNLLPDTQDDSHLIAYGSERGLEYSYATAPVVRGVFKQSIEEGERFTCGDYTYTVTGQIKEWEYRLLCDTEGTDANATLGALEPLDYIDDYQGGEITEVIVPGTDDEDIETYRQKVIDTFKSQSFGGNKADYRRFVNAISGVGGCKPTRRSSDSAWINIYVINSSYGVPSAELINTVQTAVDPEENHGEGNGMAPICHCVKIIAVEGVTVNIEVSVTFDTGYSADTSATAISKAVSDYLLQLRTAWEDTGKEDTVVRVRQVESAVLAVNGVLDVTSAKINGASENLSLAFTKIPLLGGVKVV